MIGIVGGTFDPIHDGHIRPVHYLSKEIPFASVRYVLSAHPPHRPAPSASVHHRFHMLQLALEPFPLFEADDQEIFRPGPSFTLWTLRNLRQQFGQHTLCLILGMDAYLGIARWHRWPEVATLAHIIVLSRPGWKSTNEFDSGNAGQMLARSSGVVIHWESPEMPITSTDLRRRIAAGGNVDGTISSAVLDYIHANNIYGANNP